jgi:hypothetical protein
MPEWERGAGRFGPIAHRDLTVYKRAAAVAVMAKQPSSQRICVRCMAPRASIILFAADGKCRGRYCAKCAAMAHRGETTAADLHRIKLNRLKARLGQR